MIFRPAEEDDYLSAIEDAEVHVHTRKVLRAIAWISLLPAVLFTTLIVRSAINAQPWSGGLVAAVLGTIVILMGDLLLAVTILISMEEVWVAEKNLRDAQRLHDKYLLGYTPEE